MTNGDREDAARGIRYHVSRYALELVGDDLSRVMMMIHNNIFETIINAVDEIEQEGDFAHSFKGGMPVDMDTPKEQIYCFAGKRCGDGSWDIYVMRGHMETIGKAPANANIPEMAGRDVLVPQPDNVPSNGEFRALRADEVEYSARGTATLQ